MPPVSIVIPNYNGEQLLQENLPAVLAALDAYERAGADRQSAGKSELIVVDDCSTDNSVPLLTERFPGVRLIKHEENRGFSDAVLSGVENCQYNIVVLLNSDVTPDAGFIEPLLAHFTRDEVFAVSPLIRDADGSALAVSWNRRRLRGGKLVAQRWTESEVKALAESGAILPHLFASGGSLAMRRDRFLQLGGFLPLFKPFYYEDADLGVRACRHGWSVLFEPRSEVVHPQGSTIGKVNKRRRVTMIRQRNRLLFQWLHLPLRELFFPYLPRLLLRQIEHLLLLHGASLGAFFMALQRLPKVVVERRKLKASGIVTLKDALRRQER